MAVVTMGIVKILSVAKSRVIIRLAPALMPVQMEIVRTLAPTTMIAVKGSIAPDVFVLRIVKDMDPVHKAKPA